ncbi:MAG: hypothetical protein ABJN03_17970 [Ascidiaceihabitans sp.]
MQQVGFPKSAIEHCIQNSGFVFKSGTLQNHPKNQRYTRYVDPGIVVFRQKGSGTVQSAPVTMETNTFTDKSWKVYDASFRNICTVLNSNPGVSITCTQFGKLKGSSVSNDGRTTFTAQNDRYEVMFFSDRPASFARQTFAATFK